MLSRFLETLTLRIERAKSNAAKVAALELAPVV
jgi:cystathionine beta-lyase/cystathionine gamma-synthase